MVTGVLTTLGIVTWTAFCQDLAQELVKEIIIKAGFGALSLLHRDALAKAMKKIIKELLDLLEYELGLDEDTEREELIQIQRAVSAFLKQPEVTDSIATLLQGEQLDSAVLAQAWRNVQDAPALPEGFSWQRISKRFSRKAKEIRDSIPELKAVFAQNTAVKADEALVSHLGPPPDFDLDAYAKALLDWFGNLKLDCMDPLWIDPKLKEVPQLWSVFIPQAVRENRYSRFPELPKGDEERQEQLRPYFGQPPRPVLEVCADPQLQWLVILGDPGSGKSTLLRCLALQWARDEDATRRAAAPLPLLIELRDYNQWECPSGKSFIAYLHHARNWHRFNQNALDALLHRPGRVLLLLDGLDEIFDPQQRELAVNDIFRFSNDHSDARIILTSRVVGYRPERLRDAGFRDFMLQDFDEGQIEEFLKLWHQITFSDQEEAERKRQRLAKAIADSRPIKLLAGNPLLLTLMAIINRKEELPRNRARLYEKAAELLLQQWDTEAKLLPDFPSLSAEIDLRAKAAILRKVALEMQTAGFEAANLIQGEKLIKLIEEYLLTELRFPQARKAANALVEQLRQRNFILCFLGGDSYGFVHRTFLEYFCAAEFVDQFEKKRSLSLDDLLALYDAHYREDDWQEVLRLICGQLDEKFVAQIIDLLTNWINIEVWNKETPLPALTMAVWCLSEVKNINFIDQATGGKLLLTTIDCLLYGREPIIIKQLLAAAENIGNRWPGKYLFKFSGQYPDSIPIVKIQEHHAAWPLFLAAIFTKRHWIESLVMSDNIFVRIGSIQALLKYWRDDKTHQLLRNFIINDSDEELRAVASENLINLWPDEGSINLIKMYSFSSGKIASLYSKRHSGFGEIIFSRHLNWKSGDYLNPRQPIPAAHIQEAAEKAGIPPDKIDEAVRSLSAHMGWNITKGSLAGKL
uniref:NACHT domain-containing protein n=1 Tax=Candidatus Electronema sp. TaxID=2698783 RepID=UPI0040562E7D